jgi:hypothetical protein
MLEDTKGVIKYRLITGFVIRVTQQMQQMKPELLVLPDFSPGFQWDSYC